MQASLRRLILTSALLVSAAPALTGCAPYVIVQQSGPPSALKGVQQVTVRFDWSQVRVIGKSEAEYLAEKTPEEQKDFLVIKGETDAAILQGLQQSVAGVRFAPGGAEVDPQAPGLVVQYAEVQTGIYTFVYNTPSKVLARFIWSSGGKVSDVIDTQSTVGASMSTPSDHQRMEMVGRNLGKQAGKYVVKAQGK